MANQSQRPELSAAVAAALTELEGLTLYQRTQREATGETREPRQAARPLEFDAAGFPVAQPVTGFVHRVGRLLNDG